MTENITDIVVQYFADSELAVNEARCWHDIASQDLIISADFTWHGFRSRVTTRCDRRLLMHADPDYGMEIIEAICGAIARRRAELVAVA